MYLKNLKPRRFPKRMPKHLSFEESVRLLIKCENNPRDHCIITMFLNCALRLSELTSINVEQVTADTLQIVGKGNKERTIFLTPAIKESNIRLACCQRTKKHKCTLCFKGWQPYLWQNCASGGEKVSCQSRA